MKVESSLVLSLFICLPVVVFSCSANEVTPDVRTEPRSSNERVSNQSTPPTVIKDTSTVDSGSIMGSVAKRYSELKYYKARGISEHSSNFQGDERPRPGIPFEIEYTRGQNATITWQHDEQKKLFRIEGSKSWLEIDGKRDRSFPSPRDGLMVVSLAEGGWHIFGIDTFVFRDELRMGDTFFAGLVDPKVVDERDVDGQVCYLLSGTFRGVEGSMTYWIDKEDSLIRRIERVITVRKTAEGTDYVNTARTTETYSEIEIR